jgi:hypothetical protein
MKRMALWIAGALLLCAGCVSEGSGGTGETPDDGVTASVAQAVCHRVCNLHCVIGRWGRPICPPCWLDCAGEGPGGAGPHVNPGDR